MTLFGFFLSVFVISFSCFFERRSRFIYLFAWGELEGTRMGSVRGIVLLVFTFAIFIGGIMTILRGVFKMRELLVRRKKGKM